MIFNDGNAKMADGSNAINVTTVSNTTDLLDALDQGGVILFAQGTYSLTQSLSVGKSVVFQVDPANAGAVSLSFDGDYGVVIGESVEAFSIKGMTLSGNSQNTSLISSSGEAPIFVALSGVAIGQGSAATTFDFGARPLKSPVTNNTISFGKDDAGRVIAGEGDTLTGQYINLGSGKAVTYLPGVYQEKGAAIKLGSGLIDIVSDDKIASVTIAAENTRAGDALTLTDFGTTLATFARVTVTVVQKDGALVMTLSSADGRNLPVGVVEAMLEQITFENDTISPGSSRTFTYTVTDIDGDKFSAKSILLINDLNDAPVLNMVDAPGGVDWSAGVATALFIQGGSAVDITSNANIDLTDSEDDAIGAVTIKIDNVVDTGKESLALSDSAPNGGMSAAALAALFGVTATYDNDTATLTLAASGDLLDSNIATTDLFEFLVNAVTYSNTSTNPRRDSDPVDQVKFTVTALDALNAAPKTSGALSFSIALEFDDMSAINTALDVAAMKTAIAGTPVIGEAFQNTELVYDSIRDTDTEKGNLQVFESSYDKLIQSLIDNRPEGGYLSFESFLTDYAEPLAGFYRAAQNVIYSSYTNERLQAVLDAIPEDLVLSGEDFDSAEVQAVLDSLTTLQSGLLNDIPAFLTNNYASFTDFTEKAPVWAITAAVSALNTVGNVDNFQKVLADIDKLVDAPELSGFAGLEEISQAFASQSWLINREPYTYDGQNGFEVFASSVQKALAAAQADLGSVVALAEASEALVGAVQGTSSVDFRAALVKAEAALTDLNTSLVTKQQITDAIALFDGIDEKVAFIRSFNENGALGGEGWALEDLYGDNMLRVGERIADYYAAAQAAFESAEDDTAGSFAKTALNAAKAALDALTAEQPGAKIAVHVGQSLEFPNAADVSAKLGTLIANMGTIIDARFVAINADMAASKDQYGNFDKMVDVLTLMVAQRLDVQDVVNAAQDGTLSAELLGTLKDSTVALDGLTVNGVVVDDATVGGQFDTLIGRVNGLVPGRFAAVQNDLESNAGKFESFTQMSGLLDKLLTFREAIQVAVGAASDGTLTAEMILAVTTAANAMDGDTLISNGVGDPAPASDVAEAQEFLDGVLQLVIDSGRFGVMIADLDANDGGTVYPSYTQMVALLGSLANFRLEVADAVSEGNDGSFTTESIDDIVDALDFLKSVKSDATINGIGIDAIISDQAALIARLDLLADGREAALYVDLKANAGAGYSSYTAMAGVLGKLLTFREDVQDVVNAAKDGTLSAELLGTLKDSTVALDGLTVNGVVVDDATVAGQFDTLIGRVNGLVSGRFAAVQNDLESNAAKFDSFTQMSGLLDKLLAFREAVEVSVDAGRDGTLSLADIQAITAALTAMDTGTLINGKDVSEAIAFQNTLETLLGKVTPAGRFDALINDLEANAGGGFSSYSNMVKLLTPLAEFRVEVEAAVAAADDRTFTTTSIQNIVDELKAVQIVKADATINGTAIAQVISGQEGLISRLDALDDGREVALYVDLDANAGAGYSSYTAMAGVLGKLLTFREEVQDAVAAGKAGTLSLADIQAITAALNAMDAGTLINGKNVSEAITFQTTLETLLGQVTPAGRFDALVNDLEANAGDGFSSYSNMLKLLTPLAEFRVDVEAAVQAADAGTFTTTSIQNIVAELKAVQTVKTDATINGTAIADVISGQESLITRLDALVDAREDALYVDLDANGGNAGYSSYTAMAGVLDKLLTFREAVQQAVEDAVTGSTELTTSDLVAVADALVALDGKTVNNETVVAADVTAGIKAFTDLDDMVEAAILADLVLNAPAGGFASFAQLQTMLGRVIEAHTGVNSTLEVAGLTLGAKDAEFFTLKVGGETIKLGNIDKVSFTDKVVSVVGSGGYETVQAAVDAAGVDALIRVASGTYQEQVVVTSKTGVELRGDVGAIIKAPDATISNLIAFDRDRASVVTIDKSTDIVVSGFTVDGNQKGGVATGTNPDFSGIHFNNSTGTASSNTIIGVSDPLVNGTVSGAQRGNAILVHNGDGVARVVNLTDNTVSGFQKTGVVAKGTGLTVNVSGNTITGAGFLDFTGAIAQNGIQISNGAAGSVTGNTISAIGTPRTDFVTVYIMVLGEGVGTVVSGNTLTGTAEAAYTIGVYVEGAGGANVENNTIASMLIGVASFNNADMGVINGNTFADMHAALGTINGLNIEYDANASQSAVNYTASGGNDALYGSAFDDTFNGGDGNDVIYGNSGSDNLVGGAGDDTVYGGEGDDLINGDTGNDSLFGYEGDDNIAGGDGNDVIYGGDGSDVLFAGAGDDDVYGGDGADTIYGTSGTNYLYGGADNDSVFGGSGIDIIEGGDGDDQLQGGDGDDNLKGDAGSDTIDGGDGADFLDGGDGDDVLSAGAGDDTVWGGAGDDTITGRLGENDLWGEGGNDTFFAGLADNVIGGDGTDTVFYAEGTTVADLMSVTVQQVEFIRIQGPNNSDGNTWVVRSDMSLQAAINAAASGDTILLGSGSFALDSTLIVNKALTITGFGEGQTTLITSGVDGVQVKASNVTIQDLTVNASASTGYGVKVSPSDAQSSLTGFTLKNVTVEGAGRTEVDLNGVDNSSLINVNADGKGTAGNGITLTDSNGITLTDITTSGNNWGSVAVYSSGKFYEAGSNGITFTGTYTAAEAVKVYAQETAGSVGNLTLNLGETVYKVQNSAFRGVGSDNKDSAEFMFFFGSETEAVAFATSLSPANKSVITTSSTTGGVNAEPGTNFIVGAGMSIGAAVAAASAGATVDVRAGTFNEVLTVGEDITIKGAGATTIVNGAFDVRADGATIEALAVNDGATVSGSDAGIYVAADGVSLKDLVLTGPGGSAGTFRGVLTESGKGNLTVDNVTSAGWATGVYLNPGSGTVVITNSNLSGNYVGLSVDGSSGVTVSGSTLGGTLEDLGLGPNATISAWDNVTLANGLVGNFSGLDVTLGSTTVTALGQTFANVFVAKAGGALFGAPAAGSNQLYIGSNNADTFVASDGVDRIEGGGGVDTVNLAALDLGLTGFGLASGNVTVTIGSDVTTLVGVERVLGVDDGGIFASSTAGVVEISLVKDDGFPVKLVGKEGRPDLWFKANDLPGAVKAAVADLPNEAIEIVLESTDPDYAAIIDLRDITYTSVNITLANGLTGPEKVGPIYQGGSSVTLGTGLTAINVAPGVKDGQDGATALAGATEGDVPTTLTVATLLLEFEDADFGTALGGIAVTGIASGGVAGHWEFKEPNRTDFQRLDDFLDGALSESNALLLASTTQLRFVADDGGETGNFGAVPALTFVAVDSSQALFNGGRFTTPQQARTADVINRGEDTPYSKTTGQVSQNIVAQNDPGALGATSYTLTGVNEDAFTGTNGLFADDAGIDGDLVSTIFAGSFTDPDTGEDTINGIAVVANASSATKGKWQYSSDGGTTFTDIGTVSAANALLLDDTAMLRFVPAANYNGAAPALTVRGIDGTFTGFTNGAAVFADLSGEDATGRGSAFTKATADLGLDVAAVTDEYVFSAQGGTVDNQSLPDSIGTFNDKPVISLFNFDHGSGGTADRISFSDKDGNLVEVDLSVNSSVAGLGVSPNNDANVLIHGVSSLGSMTIADAFRSALEGSGRQSTAFGSDLAQAPESALVFINTSTFQASFIKQGAGFAVLTDSTGVAALWYADEMNPLATDGGAGNFAPTLIGYLAGEDWTLDQLDGTPSDDAPTVTLEELKAFTQADFGLPS